MRRQTWLDAASARHKETRRLLFLLGVAVLLGLFFLKSEATAEVLWQSPQSSPVDEEEPPEPTPVPPTPTPQPPTPVPTEPPAEPPATEPLAEETAPEPAEAASTENVQSEPTPTEPPTVAPTPTLPPSPTPPLVQPQVNNTQPQPEPREFNQEAFPLEEESGGQNFILDRIELIDTIAVSGAYLWLCCGVGLLLVLPIFLMVLYIRGRSRILQDETYY